MPNTAKLSTSTFKATCDRVKYFLVEDIEPSLVCPQGWAAEQHRTL